MLVVASSSLHQQFLDPLTECAVCNHSKAVSMHVCVCVCVNQGGTNHKCCMWRLIDLHGMCTPTPDIPRYFPHEKLLPEIFLQMNPQMSVEC